MFDFYLCKVFQCLYHFLALVKTAPLWYNSIVVLGFFDEESPVGLIIQKGRENRQELIEKTRNPIKYGKGDTSMKLGIVV